MKANPERAIWIVDDDTEDHQLIKEIFEELKWSNPLELFQTGEQLLEKLKHSKHAPFIIICDVNLPKMGGFGLREEMLKTPNNKFHSVPFIFWSTQASEAQIRKAYDLRAHGFFIKEPTFKEWKSSLVRIIEYWTSSKMPSKEDKEDKPTL
jgi:CheY-like chemotaxis protein